MHSQGIPGRSFPTSVYTDGSGKSREGSSSEDHGAAAIIDVTTSDTFSVGAGSVKAEFGLEQQTATTRHDPPQSGRTTSGAAWSNTTPERVSFPGTGGETKPSTRSKYESQHAQSVSPVSVKEAVKLRQKIQHRVCFRLSPDRDSRMPNFTSFLNAGRPHTTYFPGESVDEDIDEVPGSMPGKFHCQSVT